jgi:hypothetical protein
MEIPRSKTITNHDKQGQQTRELGIAKDVVLGILRDRMYKDKNIWAQEGACNGRDAIRRLASLEHASQAEVARRVAAYLEVMRPAVTLDLSDERVVRICDNGAGMTRDVIWDVFSTYGASDKRAGKATSETGGFGLGAKSVLAFADHFSLVTRSIVEDKAYHVLVTKEAITVNELKDAPFEGYGTVVEAPVEDEERRAALLAKFCSTVKYWSTPAFVKDGEGEGGLASRETFHQPNDAVVTVERPGWVAAYYAGDPKGPQSDLFLVDGVPYRLDVTMHACFDLRVELTDPTLVRLAATREAIEQDGGFARLRQDIQRALQEESKTIARRLRDELATTPPLTSSYADLAQASTIRLVRLAWVHAHREESAHQRALPTFDEPFANHHWGFNPRHILLRRAVAALAPLTNNGTTMSTILRGQHLQQEELRAIEYVSREPRFMKDFPPEDSGLLDTLGPVRLESVNAEVPGWLRFLSLSSLTSHTGEPSDEDVEWTVREKPTRPEVKKSKSEPRLCFEELATRGSFDEGRYFACRGEPPTNRGSSIRKALMGDLTGLPDELAAYLKPRVVDGEEVRVEKVVLIQVDTRAQLAWLELWGVPNIMAFPITRQRKTPADPSGTESNEALRSAEVTVVSNDSRRGVTMTLGDIIQRATKHPTVIVTVDERSEHMPSHVILGEPEANNAAAITRVMYLRKPARARVQGLQAAGLRVTSLDELRHEFAQGKVFTLRVTKDGVKPGPVVTLSDIAKALGPRFVSSNHWDGKGSLQEAAATVREHDAYLKHVPHGTLVLPNTLHLIDMRLLGPSAASVPRSSELALRSLRSTASKVRVRLSAAAFTRLWNVLGSEKNAEEVFVDVVLANSPRQVVETLEGKCEFISE